MAGSEYNTPKRKDRLDTCDAELQDFKTRLSRLYDVLETGKLSLDELAPRIRALRRRQDELKKTRIQIEADAVAQGIDEVDINIVKSYTRDLKSLLEESDITERKAFLRSFIHIQRIEIDKDRATVHYHLFITLRQATLWLSFDGKQNKRLKL
jgi:site-specific DNA recombinase